MSRVALVQGMYYLVTGLWALVHIDSFQKVTGPKTDLWLVRTVGLLIIVIGSGLVAAAMRQQFDPALVIVAMGSAAAFIAVELTYLYRRTISPVYGIDAALETGMLIWWAACLLGA